MGQGLVLPAGCRLRRNKIIRGRKKGQRDSEFITLDLWLSLVERFLQLIYFFLNKTLVWCWAGDSNKINILQKKSATATRLESWDSRFSSWNNQRINRGWLSTSSFQPTSPLCLTSEGLETLTASSLHAVHAELWFGLASSSLWRGHDELQTCSCSVLLLYICYYYIWTDFGWIRHLRQRVSFPRDEGTVGRTGNERRSLKAHVHSHVRRNLRFTPWLSVQTSFPSQAAAMEALKCWIKTVPHWTLGCRHKSLWQ